MRVINSHNRIINQPKARLSLLFETLAASEDQIWPQENWPAIRFKDDLKIGSKGGHGRIRYTIIEYRREDFIKFEFTKPEGFVGTHELSINSISEDSSEITHVILMNTTFKASLLWVFVIRWLHDALIEDAFDKVENHFSEVKRTTAYNFWVKLLRGYYKRKSFLIKQA
jgi:hypothetical protein